MTGRFEIAKGTRTHLGEREVMAVACACRLTEYSVDKVRDVADDLLNLSDDTLRSMMVHLCGDWSQINEPTKECEAKPIKGDDLPF